jgi:phosphopentomutase
MKRIFISVLDSFGIGACKDAAKFGDTGSDTLGHITQACFQGELKYRVQGALNIPNLTKLGIAKAAEMSTGQFPQGLNSSVDIIGAYGYAGELSSGKDTSSGHWEIAGVPVLFDWGYFSKRDNSFPGKLLESIIDRTNIPGYLGNCHASGTDIISKLGEEHITTGKPIFYTSADSVFQIACHEKMFGLEKLYNLCETVREILITGGYNIGRVIARPFLGDQPGNFQRTSNRRDLSVEPPSPTVLKKLIDEIGGSVFAIGKVSDIYAQQGITKAIKATGLNSLFDKTINCIKNAPNNSIVFTNFVDFDSIWGHRRDIAGYAEGLELFDQRLPELISLVQGEDILILTADHGCDPSWGGTDHTRENVPILIYGPKISPRSFGYRETFADIGQTIAYYFGLSSMDYGTNIL